MYSRFSESFNSSNSLQTKGKPQSSFERGGLTPRAAPCDPTRFVPSSSKHRGNTGAGKDDGTREPLKISTDFGFEILVCSGDITKAKVDGVTTGEGITSDYEGQITQQLIDKHGHNFEKLRRTLFRVQNIVEGQAYVSLLQSSCDQTPDYKYIIHAVVPHYSIKDRLDFMKALYMNICLEADKSSWRMEYIAIPLLGTGQGYGDTEETITAAAKGLHMFGLRRKNSHLKQVQIITNEPSLLIGIYHAFEEQFQQRGPVGFPEQSVNEFCENGYKMLNSPLDNTGISSDAYGYVKSSGPKPRNRDFQQKDDTFVPKKNDTPMRTQSVKSTEGPRKKHVTSISIGKTNDPKIQTFTVSTKENKNFKGKDDENGNQAEAVGLESKEDEDDETEDFCPICMDKMTDPKALSKCKHVFCRHCIDTSFKKYKPVCPSCQTTYGEVTGNMPKDGRMEVQKDEHQSLAGYEKYGLIIIHYFFLDGIQTAEHPNPYVGYRGTSRTAYLPDCPEGRKVLSLLKVAWERRLTFTVGRSTTTGRDNVVTWNDIHHKTNLTGGESHFGYPDETYLSRVTEELASKGVTEDDINLDEDNFE